MPSIAGSPAHAGIDPEASDTRWSRGWFPRTRGDRPFKEIAGLLAAMVPPHTRG